VRAALGLKPLSSARPGDAARAAAAEAGAARAAAARADAADDLAQRVSECAPLFCASFAPLLRGLCSTFPHLTRGGVRARERRAQESAARSVKTLGDDDAAADDAAAWIARSRAVAASAEATARRDAARAAAARTAAALAAQDEDNEDDDDDDDDDAPRGGGGAGRSAYTSRDLAGLKARLFTLLFTPLFTLNHSE
jgi:hypothetical protein